MQSTCHNDLKVMVGIPCHNEANYIQQVVEQSKAYCDHVLVVDDGSTDNSARLARSAGAQVISHPRARGYGGAIISCMHALLKSDYDVLLTLDGDGQHNPHEIPQLLAPLQRDEADLIVGSRFMGRPNNVARYRKFGIDVITFLYNVAAPGHLSDAQSGFRAYKKTLIKQLSLLDNGMGLSVEVLIKARNTGCRFQEVPISCLYHEDSSSMNPLRHGVGVALDVIKHRTVEYYGQRAARMAANDT